MLVRFGVSPATRWWLVQNGGKKFRDNYEALPRSYIGMHLPNQQQEIPRNTAQGHSSTPPSQSKHSSHYWVLGRTLASIWVDCNSYASLFGGNLAQVALSPPPCVKAL